MTASEAMACTSAIISGRLTRNGRPLLWKNRDTGARSNFIARVEGKDGSIGYSAVFNEGDSLLAEAWMGMNDQGFAVMNTASYNLAPDTAKLKDREGLVMARALATCRSLTDFEQMLNTLPRPMGVQANFGAIDRYGNGAYYETCDTGFVKFDLADAPGGFIVRSNYSMTGEEDGGYGYIRYDNAMHFIEPAARRKDIDYKLFTDTISRSFHHSLIGRDMLDGATGKYIVDLDFVPRASTTASIVIEGALPSDPPGTPMVMWTCLGYPPTALTYAVIGTDIPAPLLPAGSRWSAPANEQSLALKERVFDIKRGNGPKYINVDQLIKAMRETSVANDSVRVAREQAEATASRHRPAAD